MSAELVGQTSWLVGQIAWSARVPLDPLFNMHYVAKTICQPL
jgi:hypothetical protein